jgi:hypothetical protein
MGTGTGGADLRSGGAGGGGGGTRGDAAAARTGTGGGEDARAGTGGAEARAGTGGGEEARGAAGGADVARGGTEGAKKTRGIGGGSGSCAEAEGVAPTAEAAAGDAVRFGVSTRTELRSLTFDGGAAAGAGLSGVAGPTMFSLLIRATIDRVPFRCAMKRTSRRGRSRRRLPGLEKQEKDHRSSRGWIPHSAENVHL